MDDAKDHRKPLRLVDIARQSGSRADEQEEAHLRHCEECRRILAVLARQFNKPARPGEKPEDAT
jgi:predicted anti-sigma-YlaC factor YlaD